MGFFLNDAQALSETGNAAASVPAKRTDIAVAVIIHHLKIVAGSILQQHKPIGANTKMAVAKYLYLLVAELDLTLAIINDYEIVAAALEFLEGYLHVAKIVENNLPETSNNRYFRRKLMRVKALLYLSFLTAVSLRAQDDPKKTAFDNYGPYGAFVYTDLKDALKDEMKVYKMNLSYKPVEPKVWPKITKLKNMQALNLQSVSISEWPADFTSLYNLVYLGSYNNEFKKFPDKLGALSNLMYLEIINSRIDSIPAEIAYLKKLKTFKFSSQNDTLKLPKTLKFMKSLNDFVVESAIMDSMPAPLFEVSTMKTLVLANCQIQAIPDTLTNMSNLEVLVLDFNKLSVVPRQIYKCKKLFYLSLKKNNITKIPDTICLLKNLGTLDLRENPIASDKNAIEELRILLPGTKIVI